MQRKNIASRQNEKLYQKKSSKEEKLILKMQVNSLATQFRIIESLMINLYRQFTWMRKYMCISWHKFVKL